MSLLELVQQRLGPDAISQIGRRIGADPGTTGNAVDAAVPLLIAALARNIANPAGADALDRAVSSRHDGSLLDNLPMFLQGGTAADGEGILRHVLGDRAHGVHAGIGQTTGLDAAKVAQLLPMLAPIVMAALGRMKRERSLDANGLATLITGERERLNESAPGVMGALSRFLDRNHDGSISDDVGGILGSVFGGKD
ncbi:MAG: DUF937 domain-containing protein [Gemmatimonadales bacterium]|nr:DUF937 domain-containing protein [Gemmatimonadales bacterium]